ncbi:unnamed protein product [Bursaphelenchus xylophilus]|uniref:(pine wood nematode) hypothetical protein n=1 Tax=Bursaphelenchus xylophilus TaxID=6326 RepID=A0A1I7RHL6_BURXY|nr:unnamed protein product [Bursaphelenchus xylophilus]CAG9115613.1 unnamed protein product [Bursaphelenchus xylophilus]
MFEYDRLALDVAQQFANTPKNFDPAPGRPRRKGTQDDGKDRHFSGSSMDLFDCGSSSGYGSPGVGGTPLASPAPNSSSFIAQSVQRMLLDQGFYDELKTMGKQSQLQLNANDLSAMIAGMTVEQVDKSICSENEKELLSLSTTSSQISHSSPFSPTPTQTIISNPTPVAFEDGFSQDEIAQFAELLCSPKKTPPTRYQCHICYNTGHYISDCPMRFNSPYEELTPYQGRKKCYGEFTCHQCKRRWTSQNSVANEAQSCIKCHVPVFPHKQLPVDKAVALGLVKAQRTVPTKVAPIGHGRPPFPTAVRP